jgi:hypothetical protein
MPPDRLPSEKLAAPAKALNRQECRPDPPRNNVADMSPSTASATVITLLMTQMSKTAERPQHANAVLTLHQILPFTLALPITVGPPLPVTASSNHRHNSSHLPNSSRHHNHAQSRSFHLRSTNIRPCSPNTVCPHRQDRNTAPPAQCGFLLPPRRNSTISPLSRSLPCREVRGAAQGVRI